MLENVFDLRAATAAPDDDLVRGMMCTHMDAYLPRHTHPPCAQATTGEATTAAVTTPATGGNKESFVCMYEFALQHCNLVRARSTLCALSLFFSPPLCASATRRADIGRLC